MLKSVLILLLQTSSTTIDLPDEFRIKPIRIPTFIDFSTIVGSSATVFSFLSFVGILATVGITVFWIGKAVQLGILGMQSGGKQDKIQEIMKSLRNVFTGVFMTFLFPVILSIIGIFAGVGTVFDWPRMFRSCGTDTYDYYFQAYLDQEGSDATAQADAICGYTTP